MTRTPLQLAALASTAVKGLDPVSARPAVGSGHTTQTAFITDTEAREWVIRAPLTPAAGAQLEQTVALLGLLGRRLPVGVPVLRGFVAIPEGRAMVHRMLPGRPIELRALPAAPGLAAHLGAVIAAIHNLPRGLYEEAGTPVYDADAYRTRRLRDIDRAAATGHVPAAVLSRWEEHLEDVRLWRYAPVPTHGGLDGSHVLVEFASDDAASGQVSALTGWDRAAITDPALDFADLVDQAPADAVTAVLSAYSAARAEPADPYLIRRARLSGELTLMDDLLEAAAQDDRDGMRAASAALAQLADRLHDEASDRARRETDTAADSPRVAPEGAATGPAPTDSDDRDGSGSDNLSSADDEARSAATTVVDTEGNEDAALLARHRASAEASRQTPAHAATVHIPRADTDQTGDQSPDATDTEPQIESGAGADPAPRDEAGDESDIEPGEDGPGEDQPDGQDTQPLARSDSPSPEDTRPVRTADLYE